MTTHQVSRQLNYLVSVKNVMQAYKEGLSIHSKSCRLQQVCTTSKRISFLDVSRVPKKNNFFRGGEGGKSPQVSRACPSVKSGSEDEDKYEEVMDLHRVRKMKNLERKLSHCHFVDQKSHSD